MTALKRFTKVDKLLTKKEQITKAQLNLLNGEELKYFDQIVNKKANELKGVELEKFLHRIDLIIDQSTKNQLWECNHSNITWSISKLMQDLGRMPSKSEIAENAGLSRQTVHKHLKDYSIHPLFIEQREQFRFMTEKVLAKVFYYAVNGDMNAAKLYFNVAGQVSPPNQPHIQNQQNNFIQINGMVISQDVVKHLNPEQLNKIEGILSEAVPELLTPLKTLKYERM